MRFKTLLKTKSVVKTLTFLSLLFTFFPSLSQETTVYSAKRGLELGVFNLAKPHRVIAQQGNSRRIQFSEPTIQGWVSSQYLRVNEQTRMATVLVNKLNFRIRPSLNAIVLTQLDQGYKTPVLKQEAGFSLVLAPASLEVVVNSVPTESADRGQGRSRSMDSKPSSVGIKSSSFNSHVSSPSITVANQQNKTVEADTASSLKTNTDLTSDFSKTDVATPLVSEIDADPNFISQDELNHKLAAGDSISLMVFGESDLSADNVRVPQSGQVSFPLIGSVDVLGKTTTQIERQVSRILAKGYVNNPRLSVSIFSYRPIFIRGEVVSAGSFPYSEGLTIAKAIALAGGLSDTANEDGVSILREGNLVAENLSIDSQYRVISGDIVTVSTDLLEKEAETAYIFLHGEVKNAGAYEYQQGLTIEKAVVLAGGFSLRAAKGKISVSRYAEADDTGAPKSLKRVKLHEPIMPGDVIKVGASWF